MKMPIKNLICFVFLTILVLSARLVQAQLANSWPNDVGIENDQNVLFVEKFNEGMVNILARYNDKQNTEGMTLDTDIPPGSNGPYSLKMTSITGGVNDGGYLFKKFSPGFDSTIYVRYYVKYPSLSRGYFHHESVWVGGYHPAIDYPYPRAGTCGLGSSRISIAYENVWQQSDPPGMDTYLYWGGMHSFNGGETCYGNPMINEGRTDHQKPAASTAPVDHLDQWMCIEIMIRLNNPVTAHNGELEVWQDGVEVGHWGPGFPNGHWLKDRWYNNPDDAPFEGFQWRTDAGLNLNWLWFEFYHDDPKAPSSYIKFSNLVVAKKYIGPISNSMGSRSPRIVPDINIFPNPSTGLFSLTDIPERSTLAIFNLMGKKLFSTRPVDDPVNIDISNVPKGIYLIQVNNSDDVYSGKIVIQ